MMGELTAAGDVAAGALAARAVEPRAGEAHGAAHEAGGALCLNCGTRLMGEHCHRCGQSGHVHRTAGAIGHELAHGVFHFDGKVWRTLPLLAFRPGELTRRYVAGERARFVSPLALFLFSVFLLFAVVANLPGAGSGDAGGSIATDIDDARAKVADDLLRTEARVVRDGARLAEARAAPEPDGREIARLERELATARKEAASLRNAQRFLPPPDRPAAKASSAGRTPDRPAEAEIIEVDVPDAPKDWLLARVKQARDNPKLLAYKLKTSAYKYSWVLIPISLPFIWLLFPLRRDVGMYDHAVFATHSLSFMSLFAILVASLAAAGLGGDLPTLAAMLVPPLHLYKHLKGAYRLGRAGALWRTAWMLLFAVVATTIFTVLLVAVGVGD